MALPGGIIGLVHGIPAWFSRILGASQSQVPAGTEVYAQNIDITDRAGRLLGTIQVDGNSISSSNPIPVGVSEAPLLVELASLIAGSDNPNAQTLLTDSRTDALATVNTVHYKVHDGVTYQVSYKSPEGADIADNGNVTLLIRAGAMELDLTFSVAAGGDCEIEFRESPTVTANGTALTPRNMNRAYSDSPTASAFQGPTYTGGTLLANYLNPGGTKNQSVGGTARNNTEWVLAANTSYIIRGINRSGGAVPLSIVLQWYEVVPS